MAFGSIEVISLTSLGYVFKGSIGLGSRLSAALKVSLSFVFIGLYIVDSTFWIYIRPSENENNCHGVKRRMW